MLCKAIERLDRYRTKVTACAAVPALLVPLGGLGNAEAASLNVLPLGDSLTFGWGYTNGGINYDQNDVGYRLRLQELIFQRTSDFDFVGGFGIGGVSPFDPDNQVYTSFDNFNPTLSARGETRAFDADHFGWPGARAGFPLSDPTASTDERELVPALQGQSNKLESSPLNPNRPNFATQWSGSSGIPGQTYSDDRQDVNVYGGLIQQGAGDFHAGPNPGQPWTQAAVDEATTPGGFENFAANSSWIQPAAPNAILLHIGTNTINDLDPSSDTAAEELVNLLQQLESEVAAGNITSDTKIFVAEIVPKLARDTGRSGADANVILESAQYNEAVAGLLTNTDLSLAFREQLVIVDMFDIAVTAGLLDSLGLDADDADLLDLDGDGDVDWWDGSFDDADPNDGPPNLSDITFGTEFSSNANENLFGKDDFIHLDQLGYEVMAYQWFEALEAEGLLTVIPEPASGLLVGFGMALIAGRRRRLD